MFVLTRTCGNGFKGSALFDFVKVCVFCAQMFGPSFDEGFWRPVEPPKQQDVVANHYFDDVYPFSSPSSDAAYAREMKEKRALARRLVLAAHRDTHTMAEVAS